MDDTTTAGRDLEFWLGEWDCAWEGGAGSNRVTAELDGRAILERFEAADGTFRGFSASAYHAAAGCWRQVWTDSAGNCWAFTGGREGDRFVLGTDDVLDGRPVSRRMVFSEITPAGFTWTWELAERAGGPWASVWSIRYRRRGT